MSHVVDGTAVITTDTLTDHHHCSIDREDRSWSSCTRLWQFIESNLSFVHENDWTCDQVAKRESMWYTNFIAGLIGLIFIVGLPPWCSDAFNVETKHYAVYRNETRSMFGFAVSVYRDRYGRGWWVFIFPSLIFAYLWLLLHCDVSKLLCKNVIETKSFCVSIILIMLSNAADSKFVQFYKLGYFDSARGNSLLCLRLILKGMRVVRDCWNLLFPGHLSKHGSVCRRISLKIFWKYYDCSFRTRSIFITINE